LDLVLILPGEAPLKMNGFAQEEAMNQQLRCAHCRCRFVPNPRVKTQRFCSTKPCQQARKTQWQRQKIATDPDYQADQRDGQSAWRKQHRDYWRQYRQEHPAYRERNRLLQRHRDQKRRPKVLAKMDALAPVSFVKPGIYHLIPATGEVLAKMDALSMKYHLIPMT
jgi:hypothetical protein